MAKKKSFQTNPLTDFLLRYIEEQETNLTELSLRAGLSAGSLRQLVIFPQRKPTLETCLRIAAAVNQPIQEIAQLAGLMKFSESTTIDSLHPDRIRMLKIFDQLPLPSKEALLSVAIAMQQLSKTEGGQHD